ncbi:VWA domain-containing protein [Flavobacteriales bacterium]|nr:VWA domain-containing protein [Flavobacteriales bacterium]
MRLISQNTIFAAPMNPLNILALALRTTLFAVLCVVFSGSTNAKESPEPGGYSPIDIVFVVDISGSTGGILSSVRSKFWEVQNEISRLSPTPKYRFGIVCMGRPSFKKDNNYVKILSDLTDDIDAAAYPFFQIKDVTAPGNYFMGHALDVAVNDMSWSTDPNAIKMMFLVGNGMPSAGPGYRKPIQDAKEAGIIIHSLYFLTYSNQKEQSQWKTIADFTGGKYYPIGLKEPSIVLEKPYDGAMLREANHMVNTTYMFYGREGLDRYEIQADLDEEAELQGENQVEARTFFKGTQLYQGKNHTWDLVDLKGTGLGEPEMKNRKYMDEAYLELSERDFLQLVEEKSYERKEYITIIKMLSTQREEFLREKREKMQNYRFGKTFFGVVNKTITETAERYGYSLDY